MFWSGIQDVAVELDVRHLVDGAVGGEDAFVVVAAEHRDFDLLALVLARVVLHGPQPSQISHGLRGRPCRRGRRMLCPCGLGEAWELLPG